MKLIEEFLQWLIDQKDQDKIEFDENGELISTYIILSKIETNHSGFYIEDLEKWVLEFTKIRHFVRNQKKVFP